MYSVPYSSTSLAAVPLPAGDTVRDGLLDHSLLLVPSGGPQVDP
jgi:hypothetical protein